MAISILTLNTTLLLLLLLLLSDFGRIMMKYY